MFSLEISGRAAPESIDAVPLVAYHGVEGLQERRKRIFANKLKEILDAKQNSLFLFIGVGHPKACRGETQRGTVKYSVPQKNPAFFVQAAAVQGEVLLDVSKGSQNVVYSIWKV